MKTISGFLAIAIISSFALSADAKTRQVKGYVKKDGTYVQPHFRSAPNGTKLDNYSTKGNTNPYTGKKGTVDPFKTNNSYGY